MFWTSGEELAVFDVQREHPTDHGDNDCGQYLRENLRLYQFPAVQIEIEYLRAILYNDRHIKKSIGQYPKMKAFRMRSNCVFSPLNP